MYHKSVVSELLLCHQSTGQNGRRQQQQQQQKQQWGRWGDFPGFPIMLPNSQVPSNCHMVNGGNRDGQILVQGQQPPRDFPKGHSSRNSEVHLHHDAKMVNGAANNVDMPISLSEKANDESTLPENAIHGDDIGQQLVLEGKQKDISHATRVGSTSEDGGYKDGYNWRKYGRKQVKGSEYFRYYYKCTQPYCLVKKKENRSNDGQITEIVYKGAHNHAKPHPNCFQGQPPLDFSFPRDFPKGHSARNSEVNLYHGAIVNANNNVEMPISRSEEASDIESTLPKNAIHGDDIGLQLVLEGKQKEISYAAGVGSISEDGGFKDGYNWRKYGKKDAKGSEYLRYYYKCTQPYCLVKKKEKRSNDGKIAEVVYRGAHNHAKPNRAPALSTDEMRCVQGTGKSREVADQSHNKKQKF